MTKTTAAQNKTTTGSATYTNRHTHETYELGFELGENETPLSHAWDLVAFIAARKGWHHSDITVKAR